MKILTLLFLGGLAWIAVSCSSAHKEKAGADAQLHVVTKPKDEKSAAVRMPLSDVTTRFQLQGKKCEAQIFRTPDETLPVVTNEQGNRFIDNRITVRIASEGRRIFDRSFTKESFASLLNGRFMQYAILEGIAYDTVMAGQVYFAASVSYPESDLYVPIRLKVSADGAMSIEKTDLMDDYDDTPEGTTSKE